MDSISTNSAVPNPIPPPPSSSSRRSSFDSFPRNTPDRTFTDVNLRQEISGIPDHTPSLLASPGGMSNSSAETTTTIDIPDAFDMPQGTTMTSELFSSVTESTTHPPMYHNVESTVLMQQTPPIYYPGELPPAYQVAAALPTYEEAELTKGIIWLNLSISIGVYDVSENTDILDKTNLPFYSWKIGRITDTHSR